MKPSFQRFLTGYALGLLGSVLIAAVLSAISLIFLYDSGFPLVGFVVLFFLTFAVSALFYKVVLSTVAGVQHGWKFWPTAFGIVLLCMLITVLADIIRLLPTDFTPLAAIPVLIGLSYGAAKRGRDA